MANAIEVKSRLWLGGVVRESRDRELIRRLLFRVRRSGCVRAILLCTDGLSSYAKQAKKIFRERLHDGKRGRPRLVLASGVMIAQVIKRYEGRRVVDVLRRVVVGAEGALMERVARRENGRRLRRGCGSWGGSLQPRACAPEPARGTPRRSSKGGKVDREDTGRGRGFE
jgi:hypothetical protein